MVVSLSVGRLGAHQGDHMGQTLMVVAFILLLIYAFVGSPTYVLSCVLMNELDICLIVLTDSTLNCM